MKHTTPLVPDRLSLSLSRRSALPSFGCKLAAFVAVVTLSAMSALAYTNYLSNPGFETGTFSPWLDDYTAHSVDSTSGFVYGSGTIHEPAHSGTYALKMWGDYWGNFWQLHTASQWIPAAAGSIWSADIWGYTATPDNLKGQNVTWLQVDFCDGSSNAVAGGSYYSQLISATNSPVNTWLHLVATNATDGSTNLVAPTGTAWVHFTLPFWQDTVQSGGSTYYDDANLIKTFASDPEVALQPIPQTLVYGQTATFTVQANGRTTLSYQWQTDSGPLHDDGRISGTSTTTLTIPNLTTADQANYSVKVTDTAGSTTSSSAALTVLDPGILTNPASLVKIEGQTATFTVVAAGSGTLYYTWLKNGSPLSDVGNISGSATATLTISNLTAADSGAYSVLVLGPGGNTPQSPNANLSVKPLAQAANLILNPGFEASSTTLPFWTSWNGAGPVANPPGAGETNYDGSVICELWSTGVGTWNGIDQSFTPTPGAVYTASAWLLQSAGAAIAGASEGWLEINFYNSGVLWANFQSPHITSNSVVGVWTNVTVGPVANVAGADEIRCQLNYHAMDGNGALYIDDVTFRAQIPVTITPSVSGANMILSFPTQTGASYQVLYKNDLSDASWQTLQTITGDLSGHTNISTTMPPTKRFYRVNSL